MNNIERLVAAQADSLFSQGIGYQATLEALSKQLISLCSSGPPALFSPVIPSPQSSQPAEDHKAAPEFPEERAPEAIQEIPRPPASPYRRQIPVRPRLGVANEWAAVAIRKDELDRLEREKEFLAEKQKQLLYREELDEQKRLVQVRRQLVREKEAEKEREIVAQQDAAVAEEASQERQELSLAREALKQCVGSSLRNKRLQQKAVRTELEQERRLFNESVERSLHEAQEREHTKDQRKKQLTETLKQIYDQQADVLLSQRQYCRHGRGLPKGADVRIKLRPTGTPSKLYSPFRYRGRLRWRRRRGKERRRRTDASG